MRRALILSCVLGVSCLSFSQSKPTSWANLRTLKMGDKIQVFEADSKSVSGSFQNVTEDGLSLQNRAGAQTIRKQDIRSVRSQRGTHRLRNIAIGAGVGAGAGAGISAAFWEDHGFLRGKGTGAAVGAVIGALGGTVYGALIPSHATIYAASAP
jgi:hypothetical protein